MTIYVCTYLYTSHDRYATHYACIMFVYYEQKSACNNHSSWLRTYPTTENPPNSWPPNSLSALICGFVFISWKSLIHEIFCNNDTMNREEYLMNSRIRSCKTHTCNLRILNSQKIPGPKNHELRGFFINGVKYLELNFYLFGSS